MYYTYIFLKFSTCHAVWLLSWQGLFIVVPEYNYNNYYTSFQDKQLKQKLTFRNTNRFEINAHLTKLLYSLALISNATTPCIQYITHLLRLGRSISETVIARQAAHPFGDVMSPGLTAYAFTKGCR